MVVNNFPLIQKKEKKIRTEKTHPVIFNEARFLLKLAIYLQKSPGC